MLKLVPVAALLLLALVGWFALQISMHRPARVYVAPGVFSAEECDSAVAVAEAASVWTRDRHGLYPTDDFQVSSVSALRNVSDAVDSRVLPLLRSSFELPTEPVVVKDLFLVRYSPAGQDELAMHADETTLSFSIALSQTSSYDGGGIEFDLMGGPASAVRAEQGALVMHPSGLQHRGKTVVRGTRYVLVGFVSVGDDAAFVWGASSAASATRHGLWSHCLRTVTLGSSSASAGPSSASPEEHCKPFAQVLIGLDSDELVMLCTLNALMLVPMAVALFSAKGRGLWGERASRPLG